MSNDRSYLEALQDYYARHRALPSYASIGGLLGLKSKSSVAALVARLKLAGMLESTPDRRLAPTRRFFARPLADAAVRAGLPERIDDAASDALTIDDYLIERPSQTVLVRVKGDSMVDAGILDGDLVVVEKQPSARKGDIVVAIVDGDLALKRLDVDDVEVTPTDGSPVYTVTGQWTVQKTGTTIVYGPFDTGYGLDLPPGGYELVIKYNTQKKFGQTQTSHVDL